MQNILITQMYQNSFTKKDDITLYKFWEALLINVFYMV